MSIGVNHYQNAGEVVGTNPDSETFTDVKFHTPTSYEVDLKFELSRSFRF